MNSNAAMGGVCLRLQCVMEEMTALMTVMKQRPVVRYNHIQLSFSSFMLLKGATCQITLSCLSVGPLACGLPFQPELLSKRKILFLMKLKLFFRPK